MTKTKVIVFDLDDTLYKEIDYLKSAYLEISNIINKNMGIENTFDQMIKWHHKGENVFENLITYYNLNYSFDQLLYLYRNHVPKIKLENQVNSLLTEINNNNNIIGLITDGRSITQRNKIKALGLLRFLTDKNIIISDEFGSHKPNEANYKYFEHLYPNASYYYIGDNTIKDFYAPNALGWETICLLDNGLNIHKQNFNLEDQYLPKRTIKQLSELNSLL